MAQLNRIEGVDDSDCPVPTSGVNCTSFLIETNTALASFRIGFLTVVFVSILYQCYVLYSHLVWSWKRSGKARKAYTKWERIKALAGYKTAYLSLLAMSCVSGFFVVFYGFLLTNETSVAAAAFFALSFAFQGSSLTCMYFSIIDVTSQTLGKRPLSQFWIYFSLIFPFLAGVVNVALFTFVFEGQDFTSFNRSNGVAAPLLGGYMMFLQYKTADPAVEVLKKHRLKMMSLQADGTADNGLLEHIEKKIRASLRQSYFVSAFWVCVTLTMHIPAVHNSPEVFFFFLGLLLLQIPMFPFLFRRLEAKYVPKPVSTFGSFTASNNGLGTSVVEGPVIRISGTRRNIKLGSLSSTHSMPFLSRNV